MRTMMVGKKELFDQAAKAHDLDKAVEIYKSFEEEDSKADCLFIATNHDFHKFIDFAFTDLHFYRNKKVVVSKFPQFVSNNTHARLLFDNTRLTTYCDDYYIYDIAVNALLFHNILLLKYILKNGYIERKSYYVDESPYSLLEIGTHFDSYVCTSYLIEKGHIAHEPKNMKQECWAYPWPEDKLNNEINWDFLLKDLESLNLRRYEIESLLLWFEKMCQSENNISFGLNKIINYFANLSNDNALDFLNVFKNTYDQLPKISAYLHTLKSREFTSLTEKQAIQVTFLAKAPFVTTKDIEHFLYAIQRLNFNVNTKFSHHIQSKLVLTKYLEDIKNKPFCSISNSLMNLYECLSGKADENDDLIIEDFSFLLEAD